MNKVTETISSIRARIERLPIGEPFTSSAFAECGARAAIDQALSRLVRAGIIERVVRGVFVRPELSRFVGKVCPSPAKVAETVTKATGAVMQVHGAEAAYRLGLTTQVPTQPVFYTSSSSRHLRMEGMEIRLQHVSARKLALAGRPAGLALAALWYLGKGEVSREVIEKVRGKLPPSEFEALKSAKAIMPAWMSDAIIRVEQAEQHG